ncbi:DUF1684 domain-containing protein [Sulfitobacter maritimus]|uniref:DUF1684 domain-containing protein n=1 Tax=Sulfitobacter maritimus TaxID=2741719 RepID=UPI001C2E72EF
MITTEHLEGQWREWRHAHVATMFRPYGWTSLVAQYWLEEGDRDVRFDLLPGTWSADAGQVIYTPAASGPNLSVNGAYPTAPIEIVPGRNQTYGHGQSVPVYFGINEVETVVRTSDDGRRLYAVRVRDPRETTRAEDANVSSFDYDPAWRIPGVFTPSKRVDFEAETVEVGVRETTPRVGTFAFQHEGKPYEIVLIGKDTETGVQPVAHIRDLTSGPITYGAGRVVELQFSDEANQRIDWIDFNYAVALPCAFTNFVTCPLVPPENQLDFDVLAGEKRPIQEIARTMTYKPNKQRA